MDPDEAIGPEDAGKGPAAVEAVIEEIRPSGLFVVKRDNQARVLAHGAGHQARNFVRLRPGDRVRVVLSPQDPGRGRIVEWVKD